MAEDLEVVAALVRLVAEEVDLVVLVGPDEVQRVGLVPPSGEQVERDLPADGERQVHGCELLLHGCHHGRADTIGLRESSTVHDEIS